MKTKNWKSIQPGNDIWYLIGPEYIKGADLPKNLLLFKSTIKEVSIERNMIGELGKRFSTNHSNEFWISDDKLNEKMICIINSGHKLYTSYARVTIYGTDPITILKKYKSDISNFLYDVRTRIKNLTGICINTIEANERLRALVEDVDPNEYFEFSQMKIGDKLYGVSVTDKDMYNDNYQIKDTLTLHSIDYTGDLMFVRENTDEICLTIANTNSHRRTYFALDTVYVPSLNRVYKYLLENAITHFNECQKDLDELEDLEKFDNHVLKLINEEISKRSKS